MKLIFLVILVLALFVSCSSERDNGATTETITDYPDQESWNTTVIITKEGRTNGLIEAGHVQKFSSKRLTLLSDSIKVDFYNKEGLHTSVLHAQGGKIYDKQQDMTAYGNVIVVSDSGITLYTDTLEWDNKNQKVISRIPIKVTTQEGDTLYGDSFISDPELADYEITNPRGISTKKVAIEK